MPEGVGSKRSKITQTNGQPGTDLTNFVVTGSHVRYSVLWNVRLYMFVSFEKKTHNICNSHRIYHHKEMYY